MNHRAKPAAVGETERLLPNTRLRTFCSGSTVHSMSTEDVNPQRLVSRPRQECASTRKMLMNRLLVPLVGLIIGTASITAFAQDYQRGRNSVQAERSTENKREERGDRGNRGERGNRDQGGNRGADRRPENRSVSSGGSRQGLPNAQQRLQRERSGDRRDYSQSQRGDDRHRYSNNDRRQDRRDYRSDRREVRQDYRQDRRDYRSDRRDDRRDYRNDRRDDRRDYRSDRRDYRSDRRHDRRDRRHWSHNDWRRSWKHGWSGHRYRAPSRYYRPHGYYPRSWSIGFFLARAYFAPRYYVNYLDYGISAPPYGTEWIRVDADLLLVDIDTGEVVDVLYDFYY